MMIILIPILAFCLCIVLAFLRAASIPVPTYEQLTKSAGATPIHGPTRIGTRPRCNLQALNPKILI